MPSKNHKKSHKKKEANFALLVFHPDRMGRTRYGLVLGKCAIVKLIMNSLAVTPTCHLGITQCMRIALFALDAPDQSPGVFITTAPLALLDLGNVQCWRSPERLRHLQHCFVECL